MSILAVTDVKHLAKGDYTFKFTAQMFGVPAEGKGECTSHVLNERAALKLHTPGIEITIPTRFGAVQGGKTRIIGIAEYVFPKESPMSKFDEELLSKIVGDGRRAGSPRHSRCWAPVHLVLEAAETEVLLRSLDAPAPRAYDGLHHSSRPPASPSTTVRTSPP